MKRSGILEFLRTSTPEKLLSQNVFSSTRGESRRCTRWTQNVIEKNPDSTTIWVTNWATRTNPLETSCSKFCMKFHWKKGVCNVPLCTCLECFMTFCIKVTACIVEIILVFRFCKLDRAVLKHFWVLGKKEQNFVSGLLGWCTWWVERVLEVLICICW